MRRLVLAAGVIAAIAVAVLFGVHRVRAERVAAARRQEHMMRADLAAMRTAIKNYRIDHGFPPAALHQAIGTVPFDPVTNRNDTWRLMTEQNIEVDDFAQSAAPKRPPGIVDVHSGAPGRDADGRLWSDY